MPAVNFLNDISLGAGRREWKRGRRERKRRVSPQGKCQSITNIRWPPIAVKMCDPDPTWLHLARSSLAFYDPANLLSPRTRSVPSSAYTLFPSPLCRDNARLSFWCQPKSEFLRKHSLDFLTSSNPPIWALRSTLVTVKSFAAV